MKPHNAIKTSLALFIILSFCSTCLASRTEKEVKEMKYRLRPGGFITVIGDEGYINVKSWNKDEVAVKITKRAWGKNRQEARRRLEELEIRIDHSSDELEIRLYDNYRDYDFDFWDIFDPDEWGSRGVVVDFDLMVPQEVDLRLESDEGNIEVNDIEGDITIDIDEGDIDLEEITFKDIRIDVDEGDVDIRNAKGENGRLTVRADEGNIRFKHCECRDLDVETDEGDVYLGDLSVRSCNVYSDEGDIEATLETKRDDSYRIGTDEGDIYIALPSSADIELDLETEEGRIRSDFRIDIDEYDDGERANDIIGDGDAYLEAYTSEGDIIIDRR